MSTNQNQSRRTQMQRALANEMTRTELLEFLNDPRSKKEFFELMKLKNKIGSLEPSLKKEENVSVIGPSRFSIYSKNAMLSAACLFLLGILGFYFLFFFRGETRFETVKSVTSGSCELKNEKRSLLLKSGKESLCDYKIEGELGLVVRLLPDSEFEIFSEEPGINLELNSGIVIFTTYKKNPSLKVTARVHSLYSELLGTTLVLTAKRKQEKDRILVLEGAVRVRGIEKELKITVDIYAEYSAFEKEKTGSSPEPRIQVEKIHSIELDQYRKLSEDSRKTVNGVETNHSRETMDLIQKEFSGENPSSEPVYKITLKDKKTYLGTLEEREKTYVLTDSKGNVKRIDKTEVLELELFHE
ncbi:LIMLP_03685 family anti-sigma factor [Leptospira yasudae]|uniref:LIMLP_03685 family anti-sigma factor n=1 Tax=Leptospira yasudae TaxID=2202201 RepID=UPI0014386C95|nr:iron dicitrate transport regulator FecR [Leptospira yasudae]